MYNSLSVVLHAALQSDRDERGHVDPLTHREVLVVLQGSDKEQQEGFVEHQAVEEPQPLLDAVPPGQVDLRNNHSICKGRRYGTM